MYVLLKWEWKKNRFVKNLPCKKTNCVAPRKVKIWRKTWWGMMRRPFRTGTPSVTVPEYWYFVARRMVLFVCCLVSKLVLMLLLSWRSCWNRVVCLGSELDLVSKLVELFGMLTSCICWLDLSFWITFSSNASDVVLDVRNEVISEEM